MKSTEILFFNTNYIARSEARRIKQLSWNEEKRKISKKEKREKMKILLFNERIQA